MHLIKFLFTNIDNIFKKYLIIECQTNEVNLSFKKNTVLLLKVSEKNNSLRILKCEIQQIQ